MAFNSMSCNRWFGAWLAGMLLLAGCAVEPNSAVETSPVEPNQLTITGLTLIAAPDAEPLTDATLVIRDGKILDVFQGAPATIAGRHLAAEGLVATSGLRNSHVHFTSPRLASEPQAVLTDMLLRYGFTHVVDTGSEPADTLQLRKKIQQGELIGPSIYMANGSFVGAGGSPSYLPGIQLPEVTRVEQAAPMVSSVLGSGIDGIKLFSGSFLSPEETVYMEPDVVAAVVAAAHDAGGVVVAHPTTVLGLNNAVVAGVDVIAHTTAPQIEIPQEVLAQMRSQGTALIPTLKLWRYEMQKFGQPKARADLMERAGVAQLRLLREAGISILFGTDVGYMTDYDPSSEYQLMGSAGMSWRDILRSTTTAPAQHFPLNAGAGTVAVGSPADLVIYAQDPRENVANFARVEHTLVKGEIVWSREAKSL